MAASAVWDLSRGFLPAKDPIEKLPKKYRAWSELAEEMPKLLAAGQFGKQVKDLPILYTDDLVSNEELECAMRHLSFAGQAYVWESWQTAPKKVIPKQIAIPWYRVAKKLGRPPVLSYASYALYNWRRLDEKRPIELGNLELLQNFLGGLDEEWFILVHVEIEAEAQDALLAARYIYERVYLKEAVGVELDLLKISDSVEKMYETLLRMPEGCDPYIYYNRVRPYLHGWKDNSALPDGIIYEGVEEYGSRPQKLRGETGAQSTIMPALEAVLGIKFTPDQLLTYLLEMRSYMPREHRRFLETLEERDEHYSVRNFVLANREKHLPLLNAYNRCVELVAKFFENHLEYAASYIHKQAQASPYNPTGTGTGGTPFMKYLKKHLDETRASIIT